MTNPSLSPLDRLWAEYNDVFRRFDDLTLARWMAQTLGQVEGRCWRLSHPLLAAYRLAAQVGNERQIWLKRMATAPAGYSLASCCRSPLLPLISREVAESGLICMHCNETAIPFEDLPSELQALLKDWSERYAPIHQVAHWDDHQRRRVAQYDTELEKAATAAERLLRELGKTLAPRLLEHYPAIVWEDQDECLEVRPEDIPM